MLPWPWLRVKGSWEQAAEMRGRRIWKLIVLVPGLLSCEASGINVGRHLSRGVEDKPAHGPGVVEQRAVWSVSTVRWSFKAISISGS